MLHDTTFETSSNFMNVFKGIIYCFEVLTIYLYHDTLLLCLSASSIPALLQ